MSIAPNVKTDISQVKIPTLHTLLNLPEHMDLCQIELIYRAEGNANMVLALPQFKKVLRLPKIQTKADIKDDQQQTKLHVEKQQQQQAEQYTSSAIAANLFEKVGSFAMQDFIAYIKIIRRLLGNEFIYTPDIVAIPKAKDRLWINEHMRSMRPSARLDKEFGGQFGLLLPDATHLPDTFDVLLSNLQATTSGDTYAIEIKPKQGWLLLPNDVNDLFDLMPTTTAVTMKSTPTVTVATSTAAALTVAAPSKTTIKPILTTATVKKSVEKITTTQSTSAIFISNPSKAPTTISTEVTANKMAKMDCRCRYCLMQYMKLRMGKINNLSSYCPIELFSGVPERMLYSLDALFACPQNNLRIFQNGNLIYGDHANSISWQELNENIFQGDIMVLIKHLLVTCLLREYGTITVVDSTDTESYTARSGSSIDVSAAPETGFGKIATTKTAGADSKSEANVVEGNVVVKAVVGEPKVSCAMLAENLQNPVTITTTTKTTPATKIISATTSTAQKIKRKRIESTTEMETNPETSAPTTTTEAEINKAEILCLPKNCVLQKILHLQLLAKQNFYYMWQKGYASKSEKSFNALNTLLAKQSVEHINFNCLCPEEQYLLGATALDCSIMLTFQEIKFVQNCLKQKEYIAELVQLSDYNKSYLTKVTLLDLDPKPDSHFCKYIKQTRDIEQSFRLS